MKYLLLCLILSGCTLPFNVDHTTSPETQTVRVRRGDTLRIGAWDVVQAKKIKNRGTLIVQVGTGNIAAPVKKVKAPVAVGPQASATQEVNQTSFLDTVKSYAAGIILLVLVMVLAIWRYSR